MAAVISILTIAACKKFKWHEVFCRQERETEFNESKNYSDVFNECGKGETLKLKELNETEFADIDCTYDDHMYSQVDDVPLSNLKPYQPFPPTTFDSPSAYMVSAKEGPDVLPDSNLYEEIGNPVHVSENAMTHYQQPHGDNDQKHFNGDEDDYMEMS